MKELPIRMNSRYIRPFEIYLNDDRFKKQLKKGIFIMSNLFDEGDDRNEFGKVVDIQHEKGTREFKLLYHQNEIYDNYIIESVTPMMNVDYTSIGVAIDNDYRPAEECFTIHRIVKFFPTSLKIKKN